MPFAGTKNTQNKTKTHKRPKTDRDHYAVMELELVRNVFYSLFTTADRLYPPQIFRRVV